MIEAGLNNVEVEIDAEAVTNAITNDPRNAQGHNILVTDCRNLLKHGNFIGIHHTLREGNICTDALANLGHSGDWGTTKLDQPPTNLKDLLQLDAAGAVTSRVKI